MLDPCLVARIRITIVDSITHNIVIGAIILSGISPGLSIAYSLGGESNNDYYILQYFLCTLKNSRDGKSISGMRNPFALHPLILFNFVNCFDRSPRALQGDTLFIERPYARPTSTSSNSRNDSSVCLEFGPATLLYVLPYEPEEVYY